MAPADRRGRQGRIRVQRAQQVSWQGDKHVGKGDGACRQEGQAGAQCSESSR
jgi:hypothetical protein